jgi:hypothetical protein
MFEASSSRAQVYNLLQHRVRLAVFTHGAEALEDEGKNAEVSASPESQRIAVRTTASRVHMYRVQPAAEQALPPSLAQLAPALRPAHIVLTQSVDISSYGCGCALLAGAPLPLPFMLATSHLSLNVSMHPSLNVSTRSHQIRLRAPRMTAASMQTAFLSDSRRRSLAFHAFQLACMHACVFV